MNECTHVISIIYRIISGQLLNQLNNQQEIWIGTISMCPSGSLQQAKRSSNLFDCLEYDMLVFVYHVLDVLFCHRIVYNKNRSEPVWIHQIQQMMDFQEVRIDHSLLLLHTMSLSVLGLIHRDNVTYYNKEITVQHANCRPPTGFWFHRPPADENTDYLLWAKTSKTRILNLRILQPLQWFGHLAEEVLTVMFCKSHLQRKIKSRGTCLRYKIKVQSKCISVN